MAPSPAQAGEGRGEGISLAPEPSEPAGIVWAAVARKKVYIAYTGGTIGMEKTPEGYRPRRGFLAEQMAEMPELRDPEMPACRLHEYEPLLDSSNMTPAEWLRIASDVAGHHDAYDGFIVLHGTDTMAYTASALPFMLQGLGKPVVVTGSQIPLAAVRNDARENLITALQIASRFAIPEVCLYFGGKLLRGCRAVKVDADGLEAFASPNFPPLGEAGVEFKVNWDLVRPPPPAGVALRVQALTEARVGVLRLFPGISASVVANVLRPPLHGLVLETFGAGNAPDRDPELLAAIAEATARGVVVVATTQCLSGTARLGQYATGAALAKAGVISGYDLTPEAALAKLFYLFSIGLSPAEVRLEMPRDYHGEITVPG